MRIVVKPIECISYTDTKGNIKPLRFRVIEDNESYKVIKVDKVITKEIEKRTGYDSLVFRCQSLIDGYERLYELRYELNSCKWVLLKI